jgi:hypothetical protein
VLLQSLHNAPRRAAELAQALPAAAQAWRPAPEQWTAREITAHLAAADPPFEQRLACILAETNPWLPAFGPETARPETTDPLADLLARFQANRQRLVQMISAAAPEAWQRPACHETMGATTFYLQVHNIANHDADHVSQLQRLGQAWEEQARA